MKMVVYVGLTLQLQQLTAMQASHTMSVGYVVVPIVTARHRCKASFIGPYRTSLLKNTIAYVLQVPCYGILLMLS